jgi:hypothetical protein
MLAEYLFITVGEHVFGGIDVIGAGAGVTVTVTDLETDPAPLVATNV